jgi:hypothetical protein
VRPHRSAAAIQDIWDDLGCASNTPEIVEESGMAGGNTKVASGAKKRSNPFKPLLGSRS